MSTSREVTVWCDCCRDWTYGRGGPHSNAKDARKGAKEEGWARELGQDLCTICKTGDRTKTWKEDMVKVVLYE